MHKWPYPRGAVHSRAWIDVLVLTVCCGFPRPPDEPAEQTLHLHNCAVQRTRLLQHTTHLVTVEANCAEVWSPYGGWWPDPVHWKRNTALCAGCERLWQPDCDPMRSVSPQHLHHAVCMPHTPVSCLSQFQVRCLIAWWSCCNQAFRIDLFFPCCSLIFTVTAYAWSMSSQLEKRYQTPLRPIPSALWNPKLRNWHQGASGKADAEEED